MKKVKIVGFSKRFRKTDNSEFYVFELFGGPVAHVSSTGKLSLSVPKVTIPSNSMDEELLKASVGLELEGSIVAEECAPVEFVNAQGIKGIRRHNWIFKPTADDQRAAPLTQGMSTPEVEVTEDVEDLQ